MEIDLKQEVEKAAAVIASGGVILCPTETIWGLSCSARDEKAIERIYQMKGRDQSKPLIILVDHENMIESYVENVPEIAYQLLEAAVRPLTIVFDKAKRLATNVASSDGSIGIRVTTNLFCQQLIRKLRQPIVSTSANLSGAPSPSGFGDIPESIIEQCDYIYPFDHNLRNPASPSSLIKLGSGGEIKILRK